MHERSLWEVAALFLRLGATAFGGPAAHIALLEDEVVRRRAWVSREEFLDLVSASNVIPGPNSTELAIHLGYRRAGWAGLVVAGACFIVPAVLIVWVLAWSYVRYGARPEFGAVLAGMQPVVLAVVLQAVWRLGRSALRGWRAWVLAAGSVMALLLGVHELLVLGGAAVLALLLERGERAASRGVALVVPFGLQGTLLGTVQDTVREVLRDTLRGPWQEGVVASAGAIFLSFAKIGSVLFGSGYVLLAFLRREFVERNGWLTDAQVIDAITIGQITPGPVFTTATFVGYLLGGNAGALAATIGIFLPAFVFVAISAPIVDRIRRWQAGATMLGGLHAASLALMGLVIITLSGSTLRSPWAVVEFAVASALLLFTRAGAGVVLLAGAVTGLLLAYR